MKVRLGRSTVDPTVFEDRLMRNLRGAMEAQSVRLSAPKIQRLAQEVQYAAEQEALKLFPAIIEIMDRDIHGHTVQGLTYDDLIRSGFSTVKDSGWTPPGWVAQGAIGWPDLSPNYVKEKARRYPDRRYRMFEFSGRLRAYFRSYGDSIVRNRFGGVRVKVKIPKELRETSRKNRSGDVVTSTPDISYPRVNTPLAGGKTAPGYTNILLGAISVTIFPGIEQSLLPMLRSGHASWTDISGNDGRFEEALFPNADDGRKTVAMKLVNKNNPYRPLVLPAVQFWMQVRIPAAIYRTIKAYIRHWTPK